MNLEIVCPGCGAVHSVDGLRIPSEGRSIARCARCRERFYVEKRSGIRKGNPREERYDYVQSYFERRSGNDRRSGLDRRSKPVMKILPFCTPTHDYILFFNKEGEPVGFFSPGKRAGDDRRRGADRRAVREGSGLS